MKLTIISGRSGSGKSTVLHILEDRGYYCIDNLPASLLPSLANRISSDESSIPNVAVSIDARNSSTDLQQLPKIIGDLSQKELPTEIIFLDANSQTLLKRFSESRRMVVYLSIRAKNRSKISRAAVAQRARWHATRRLNPRRDRRGLDPTRRDIPVARFPG